MDLLAANSSCRTLGYLRPPQRVAGVGGDDGHSYRLEAAVAGDAGADRVRARLLAGEASVVGPDEDVLRSDFVRRLAAPAEEVLEHARVGLDRPKRSGASPS